MLHSIIIYVTLDNSLLSWQQQMTIGVTRFDVDYCAQYYVHNILLVLCF
jgi:hypothetical protein